MSDSQPENAGERLAKLEVSLDLKLDSMGDKLDAILVSQQKGEEELKATSQTLAKLESDFSNLEKANLEERLTKVEKKFTALAAMATAVSAVVSVIIGAIGWLLSMFK